MHTWAAQVRDCDLKGRCDNSSRCELGDVSVTATTRFHIVMGAPKGAKSNPEAPTKAQPEGCYLNVRHITYPTNLPPPPNSRVRIDNFAVQQMSCEILCLVLQGRYLRPGSKLGVGLGVLRVSVRARA